MLVRVVLADPHELVCTSLRVLLEGRTDIEVVGSTHDGTKIEQLSQRYEPDVLLTEALFPKIPGVEVVQQVAGSDTSSFLVVSHCDEPGIARKMLEGGACGYLLKRSSPSLLFEAIYGVADDQGGWLSPSLSQSLFTESTALEQVHERLTVREQEMLSFVGKGFQNAEIADHLHIGVGTVKNHVYHILQKLEPSSRYRLIAWVHLHDLLQHLPSPDDKS